MNLIILNNELLYILELIRMFRTKCKTKAAIVNVITTTDCTYFIYSSDSHFLRYKINRANEFTGKVAIGIDFIENICNLMTTDDIIEIDVRDKLIVAHQSGTTLKGQIAGRCAYDDLKIEANELHELSISVDISNKLLMLDLEEMGYEQRDPYAHLYNINKTQLIKMSSFCALMQTLAEEGSEGDVTLTQNILNICTLVGDGVSYYKYYNSFYIKSDVIEIRMPLANCRFPSLDFVINSVRGGQAFCMKSSTLLDICNKCYALKLTNKKNRVNVAFNDGILMYDYNGVLIGTAEVGTKFSWQAAFNPLLMRNIVRYIGEDIVTIHKKDGCGNILITNSDNSITFMLALCK